MKKFSFIPILLLFQFTFCWAQQTPEQKGNSPDEKKPELPNVSIIQTFDKDKLLEEYDIIIPWEGVTQFGQVYIKHGSNWYGAGGFVGGLPDFLVDEMKVKKGKILYISGSPETFNTSKYGRTICGLFQTKSNNGFEFFCISKDKAPELPKYRDYYDEDNKKIEYPDYDK